MSRHILLLYILITTATALSRPLQPSLVQLSSQNLTTNPAVNTTATHLGIWPATPFQNPLDQFTNVEVLKHWSFNGPEDTEGKVLQSIDLFRAKIISRGGLGNYFNFYSDLDGLVAFSIYSNGLGPRPQRRQMVHLLDYIEMMVEEYGPAAISGTLVDIGNVDVARFGMFLHNG